MSDNKPALVALDWGTSALRAFLVGPDGAVLEQRSRPWGILSLPDGGYPAAFASITDGWQAGTLPAIACGMVGSRSGWKQVPYLALPCDPASLAGALDQVPVPGAGVLHLVPGLLDPAGPDVMRGEETEAFGALEALADADGEIVLVMPGTHSKWVRSANRVLTGFSTYMTGELFAVLTRHSILAPHEGQERPDPEAGDDAFRDGVRAAAADGLARRLFSTRALTLTGQLPETLAPDYLSGLLIGEELCSALPLHPSGRVVLIGAPALTQRYALAFATIGRLVPTILQEAAVRGLYRIALSAGLLSPAPGDTPPC